ncbi:NAC domain containing protein, partial [Parasponia andersonii]
MENGTFFTPRDRKYKKGNRPNGATRNGYWKAIGSNKVIMSNGSQIGRKKHLAFHTGKDPSGSKTDWNMHEFTFLSTTQMREPNGDDDTR